MKIKLKNRRTQLKRAFCIWMLLLIAIIHTNTAFAQVKESEAEKQTEQIQEQVQEKTEEEKVLRFPNKLEAKEPPKNSQDNENSSNNKGTPTEPSIAKAQLIENVNNANGDYPIHHGNANGEIKDKYCADARQFITFKTKSGKTFHLIINHDEEGQNVMLLTEVSEDDLLNMVEAKEKPKEVVKEEPVKQEKTEEVKPEKKEEKSSTGTYILLALVTLGALGAGYYFKIAKKKEDKELEALEEDDDFFSEAEVNEEMENEEVENQGTEDETDDSEDELEE